jgi:hypothetical protein
MRECNRMDKEGKKARQTKDERNLKKNFNIKKYKKNKKRLWWLAIASHKHSAEPTTIISVISPLHRRPLVPKPAVFYFVLPKPKAWERWEGVAKHIETMVGLG